MKTKQKTLLKASVILACIGVSVVGLFDQHSSIYTDMNLNTYSSNETKLEDSTKLSNKPKINLIDAVQLRKIVKYGDSGSDVGFLQQRLLDLGYKVVVDSSFGDSTLSAVKKFQFNANLEQDGCIGEDTMYKLIYCSDEYLKYHEVSLPSTLPDKSSIESTVNSQFIHSDTPYFLWINLESNVVTLFSGYEHNWKVYEQFECSSGAPSTGTIRGFYKTNLRGDNLKINEHCYVKYYTQICGNFLFHSVPYDEYGNVTDSRIGYDISHGCVRLTTSNAKFIYDNIPKDSLIFIN